MNKYVLIKKEKGIFRYPFPPQKQHAQCGYLVFISLQQYIFRWATKEESVMEELSEQQENKLSSFVKCFPVRLLHNCNVKCYSSNSMEYRARFSHQGAEARLSNAQRWKSGPDFSKMFNTPHDSKMLRSSGNSGMVYCFCLGFAACSTAAICCIHTKELSKCCDLLQVWFLCWLTPATYCSCFWWDTTEAKSRTLTGGMLLRPLVKET